MRNPDSPPGKDEKYARRERERRFLLAAMPKGHSVRRVLIEDRYLVGTRLRLRRMTDLDPDGEPGRVTYKLTQKIPSSDRTPGLITTLYLSAPEYHAVSAVPARRLRKVRTSIPPFGVDEFQDTLTGLILAEAEFDTDDEAAAMEPPEGVVAEVTADERFTGGRLVEASSDQIRRLIAEFGIVTTLPSAVDRLTTKAHVRLATASDVSDLLATDALATDPQRRERVAQAIELGECWMAELDGQCIGYMVVNTCFYQHPFVWLIVVAERFRRRGVGSALMRHALALFPDHKVFTSTNESNDPSRRLMGSLGFERAGMIEHLDEGDPEIVYVRRPAPS
jgi:GNAT superfamily N-acetyltransferase